MVLGLLEGFLEGLGLGLLEGFLEGLCVGVEDGLILFVGLFVGNILGVFEGFVGCRVWRWLFSVIGCAMSKGARLV